ncbi:hypothetical protein AGMMS50267_02630 [Spirochaetia bacterium]|nr:hypothetical protein AGMMS50267_02630 [Spirochaetia bacterium]
MDGCKNSADGDVVGNSSTILLTTINAKWIHPSLAMRLLKANLGELEEGTAIVEFALRQPLAEKVGPVLAARPRILGISVSIWNHRATVELLQALEQVWGGGTVPRPVIVLGGPEVSYLPLEAELLGYADWVVRGEGEVVFRELCGVLLERDEAELYRDKNGLGEKIAALPSVESGAGKFITAKAVDLTGIDPGYRLYTGEDLGRKLVYVEASRGCPFGCEFCLSSLDRRVREFPLDGFLTEMAALIERGARTFKFLDRTFNLDIARARRIMEFFLGRIGEVSPLCVHFEMVPARFPAELRELLSRFPTGSLRLEVGIQTFNSDTAALIGRDNDPVKELETLNFLRQHTSAIVHADLIAGLPGEDLASFGEGFDQLWGALSGEGTAVQTVTDPQRNDTLQAEQSAKPPAEIQLGILKCLPGTPIVRHSETCGMRYAPDPPYEALETAALPARDLDRVKNFARFWELIVNRDAFPDLTARLFPGGKAVFGRFMEAADWLLARFGRNWGIDRAELRAALEAWENHKR